MNRLLTITGDVTQDMCSSIIKKITKINAIDEELRKHSSYTEEPITIQINTFGGCLYSCLGLLSVIEKSVTPITTVNIGSAMSAGFLILIAGNERHSYRLSTSMMHGVYGDAWGTLPELQKGMCELTRLENMVRDFVFKRTQLTKKEIKEIMDTSDDCYYSSTESLKKGIIDKIL